MTVVRMFASKFKNSWLHWIHHLVVTIKWIKSGTKFSYFFPFPIFFTIFCSSIRNALTILFIVDRQKRLVVCAHVTVCVCSVSFLMCVVIHWIHLQETGSILPIYIPIGVVCCCVHNLQTFASNILHRRNHRTHGWQFSCCELIFCTASVLGQESTLWFV